MNRINYPVVLLGTVLLVVLIITFSHFINKYEKESMSRQQAVPRVFLDAGKPLEKAPPVEKREESSEPSNQFPTENGKLLQ